MVFDCQDTLQKHLGLWRGVRGHIVLWFERVGSLRGLDCWSCACLSNSGKLKTWERSSLSDGSPAALQPLSLLSNQVVRSGLSWLLTLLVAKAQHLPSVYGSRSSWHLLITRGLLGTTAMSLYYISLRHLPLPDAVCIHGRRPNLHVPYSTCMSHQHVKLYCC